MKEEDIRPTAIFDQFLSLCQQDIKTFFKDAPMYEILCPACRAHGRHSFEKYGFNYELCPECFTLYVNPRPHEHVFEKYYQESKSAEFWATTFYKETADNRRERIWKPKAAALWKKMQDLNVSGHEIVDIGGGYGIFAQEMEKISGKSVVIIEPGPSLAAVCRSKGLNVIEKFFNQVSVDDLPDNPKVFVSFELFEHLNNPEAFLTDIRKSLAKTDLFIFTTLSSQGIDILTLWEESQSVHPPHHLNFFNPGSIEILLKRVGLRAVEISTPGKLDIDLLCEHASKTNRFWKRFKDIADDNTKHKWQEMIVKSGWSSHMMVICQKDCC